MLIIFDELLLHLVILLTRKYMQYMSKVPETARTKALDNAGQFVNLLTPL